MVDASIDDRMYQRLRWRARRGLLENDILLGRFMDAELMNLAPDELSQFDELLRMEDNDLMDVLMGRVTVAKPHLEALVDRIRAA